MCQTVCNLLLACLLLFSGCTQKKIADAPVPRQSRTTGDYAKKLAGPELAGLQSEYPGAKVQVRNVKREGRHWLVDIVVASEAGKSRKRVLVDRRGKILEERPL